MLIAAVDFKTSWTTLWTSLKLTAGTGTLLGWLSIIGMLMVLFAVIRYILDRRKGQRGNHVGLIITALIGVICYSPSTTIGWLLGLLDGAINIVIHAFGG